MDSTNLHYTQKLFIPPLKIDQPTIHPALSLPTQNSIKIPPFPARSIPQLSGYKRQTPLFFEQDCIQARTSSKKLKFDSFNVLSNVKFSERDPYWPAGHSSETPIPVKPVVSSVNYQKLNTKIINTKGMTINISVKPKEGLRSIPKLDAGIKEQHRFERQTSYNNIQSKFNLDEAREPIYNAICKKLEENCQALFHSMKDLLVLRQHFSPSNTKIPTFDRGLEETLPGTPCTVSAESVSEVRSECEASYSETKTVKEESDISETQIKEEESAELNIKKEKRTYNRKEKKQTSSVQDISDAPRRMNRLQVLRTEKEAEGNLSEKIVKTAVGTEYQANIPDLVRENERKTSKRLVKLVKSPEISS